MSLLGTLTVPNCRTWKRFNDFLKNQKKLGIFVWNQKSSFSRHKFGEKLICLDWREAKFVHIWHIRLFGNSDHENKFILFILDLLLSLCTEAFLWGFLFGKWSWHNKKIFFHRNSCVTTVTFFCHFLSKFLVV
jgi:hypothetical protein